MKKRVVVEIGTNGIGILENIFNELKNFPVHSIPIKYNFVCGRNEELGCKLQQALKTQDLESTALKRCNILGFMNASSKYEIMNICSLIVANQAVQLLLKFQR
jgi:hypothetical protein